jgi:hypothetical protein
MRVAALFVFSFVLSGCLSADLPAGKFTAYINKDRQVDSGFNSSTVAVKVDDGQSFYFRHQSSYAWKISRAQNPAPQKEITVTIFDPDQELNIFISSEVASRYRMPNPAWWPQTTVLSRLETGLNYELRIQVLAMEAEADGPRGEAGEIEYVLSMEFWNEQGELVLTLI